MGPEQGDDKEKRIYLTVKLKLDPSSEEERRIDRNIEGNRVVYNQMVTYCKLHLENEGRLPTQFDLNKLGAEIWRKNPSVKCIYNNSMHVTSGRVLQAYKKILEHNSKPDAGGTVSSGHRPRYKTVKAARSYGYPKRQDFGFSEKGKKKYIRLGKVGNVRFRGPEFPKGTPKTCIVSRIDMGTHSEYYASVTFEMPEGYATDELYTEIDTSQPVGIDIGISSVAVFSDGTVFENPKHYLKLQKRFEKLQRRLSKAVPFTEEYDKAKSRLDHAYKKLKNMRKNTVNHIAHDAVYLHGGIAMEDLSVKKLRGISRSRRMTNYYNDASLGAVQTRIRDVAACAHRKVVLVDPRGTSQMCSACGAHVKKGLDVRIHHCPECGLRIDRDLNAAINILHRGWTGHPDPDRSNRPA